jgi:hypothetical protein
LDYYALIIALLGMCATSAATISLAATAWTGSHRPIAAVIATTAAISTLTLASSGQPSARWQTRLAKQQAQLAQPRLRLFASTWPHVRPSASSWACLVLPALAVIPGWWLSASSDALKQYSTAVTTLALLSAANGVLYAIANFAMTVRFLQRWMRGRGSAAVATLCVTVAFDLWLAQLALVLLDKGLGIALMWLAPMVATWVLIALQLVWRGRIEGRMPWNRRERGTARTCHNLLVGHLGRWLTRQVKPQPEDWRSRLRRLAHAMDRLLGNTTISRIS